MIQNILYIILAAFGLGFLVFIHELGHYFMARRVKMTVEAFGIGFGKPIYTWKRNGVDWNLNILPFGGYVRIAGMEKKGHLEPYQIPDGFYGKKPWDRIKVAVMGPLVNIVFALFAFTIIWSSGGREKPFSEYTHLIGWVDPQSDLYKKGLRPGDEITKLRGHKFEGFTDLLYASILNDPKEDLNILKIDYEKGTKTPLALSVDPTQDLKGIEKTTKTVGMLSPALYLIYDLAGSNKNPFTPGSPMAHSGIQPNDRIVSADGQLIFSSKQLNDVINQPMSLVTIQRGDQVFVTRIPRLKVSDLRLTSDERAELDDWDHAAGLNEKVAQLHFIPYNVTHDCIVEKPFAYIDEYSEEHHFADLAQGYLETPLQTGDQILAVDGNPVKDAIDLLSKMQTKQVHLVVERNANWAPVSWKQADAQFASNINWKDLDRLTQSIGTSQAMTHAGNLYLLNPVTPVLKKDLPLSEEEQARANSLLNEQRKEIEKLKDPKQKAEAIRWLEEAQKKLMLGISLQDREIVYNPLPLSLFTDVFNQTWRTISNLFTGHLNPKWMSGPVGIVQVIHYGWMTGAKEALFWMAVISLNLGILNLFPIPVLDGGHICFSLFESITKKRLKAKTMERMIIPFVVIMVGFFIYLTYNDIVRLLGHFF
ncbi:MAG TPA: site-2 protease family protein [Rhabdochlamydiaceae bacterium]|nr:site-2 protease family protein [Rhabdochlamydiaceae bacterium]